MWSVWLSSLTMHSCTVVCLWLLLGILVWSNCLVRFAFWLCGLLWDLSSYRSLITFLMKPSLHILPLLLMPFYGPLWLGGWVPLLFVLLLLLPLIFSRLMLLRCWLHIRLRWSGHRELQVGEISRWPDTRRRMWSQHSSNIRRENIRGNKSRWTNNKGTQPPSHNGP